MSSGDISTLTGERADLLATLAKARHFLRFTTRDITDEQARRKVELLDECFPSQTGRDWWDDEMFLGLMRLRGVETRSRYAEAFHTTKVKVAL